MIRAEQLCRRYGGSLVLEGLSLQLRPGETLVVSGRSGAGKTTLLRLLAGLDRPDAGTIEIDGRAMAARTRLVPPHARGIAMVFQRPALWPHMSAARHLYFVARGARAARRRRTQDLLQRAGLLDLSARRPHELSEGQARRVALARALAATPRYLLLDEPLINLDAVARDTLLELLLSEAAALEAGILYVTHDDAEARRLGGTRAWLRNGRLWAHPQDPLPHCAPAAATTGA
jgi:iron(III) transport system ATP-binding protein